MTSYCKLGVLSLRDFPGSIALPEADLNYSDKIVPWDRILFDIMFFSVVDFVLSVNE